MIAAWIVALVGIGFLAGSAGSDFSEDFKLPASDSAEAFELLEDRFEAQSGDTATIVFKAPAGVGSPSVRKRMEALFATAEELPHVSEVASPYAESGAAAISENGEIAYATVQYDKRALDLPTSSNEAILNLRPTLESPGLQVEARRQPSPSEPSANRPAARS